MRLGELVVVFLLASVALGGVTVSHFRDMEWAQPGFFGCVGVFLALFVHFLTVLAAASIGARRERDNRGAA